MKEEIFISKEPFELERGGVLPELRIAYHTFGERKPNDGNVVWVCHALTANSNAEDWWPGLIGKEKYFNPSEHFVICANIIGSCYGSSGPLSAREKEEKYFSDFPVITIRDMVNAHILLRKELGIEKISIAIGGSMGGYQVLEWAIIEPNVIQNQILLCTAAKESAWGIAIHSAQRMAIETDPTWKDHDSAAGTKGIQTARAIGMITYRNYDAYIATQTDEDDIIDDFKATSYLEYQAEKLSKRFNVYSYWLLTKAMDSHNVGRDRGNTEKILSTIQAKTLIVGIKSDFLCPVAEQQYLHANISGSKLEIIDSIYGHDGFLIEFGQLSQIFDKFLS